MSTGTLAIIIFLVILAQVAVVILLGLYRRKQQYKTLTNQASEVQTAPATELADPITSVEVVN
ncbi:MAG: hypothetical protein HOE78_13970, partial [Gammaproteobacteria bacterium]|nr:hypothetical protein [Gammaproteobacteria bacterium]